MEYSRHSLSGFPSVSEVPHHDNKPFKLGVGVCQDRIGPEASLAGRAGAVEALPVQPGAVPPVLGVAGQVAGAAGSQAGDDGHLLEEQNSGGESHHLLCKDSLASPEEGLHVCPATGSCRLTNGQ